jgi:hypothetical protein
MKPREDSQETTLQPKPHWASLFGKSTRAKAPDPLDTSTDGQEALQWPPPLWESPEQPDPQ